MAETYHSASARFFVGMRDNVRSSWLTLPDRPRPAQPWFLPDVDEDGHEPGTGVTLFPVDQAVYDEWTRGQRSA